MRNFIGVAPNCTKLLHHPLQQIRVKRVKARKTKWRQISYLGQHSRKLLGYRKSAMISFEPSWYGRKESSWTSSVQGPTSQWVGSALTKSTYLRWTWNETAVQDMPIVKMVYFTSPRAAYFFKGTGEKGGGGALGVPWVRIPRAHSGH